MARPAEPGPRVRRGGQALSLIAAAVLAVGATIFAWPAGSGHVRGGWRAARPVTVLEAGRRSVVLAGHPVGELPAVIDLAAGEGLDLRDAAGRGLRLESGAWSSLHGARIELRRGRAWLSGPLTTDWMILVPPASALRLEGSAVLRVEVAGLRVEVAAGRLWIGMRSIGAGRAVIVDAEGRAHHVPPTRGELAAGRAARCSPRRGADPLHSGDSAWGSAFVGLLRGARRGEGGALTRAAEWAREQERGVVRELLASARIGRGAGRSRRVAVAIELGGAAEALAVIDALSVTEVLEIQPHLRGLAGGEPGEGAAAAAAALALAGDLDALPAVSVGLGRAQKSRTVERLAVAALRLGVLRPVADLRAALHRLSGAPGSAALFAALGEHGTEADLAAVCASEQEALARCAVRTRRPLGAGFLEVWPGPARRHVARSAGAAGVVRPSPAVVAALEHLLGDPRARITGERLDRWSAFGVTRYELERSLAGERELPREVLEDLQRPEIARDGARSPAPDEDGAVLARWRQSRARRHLLEELVLQRLEAEGSATLRDEAWQVAPLCGGYRLWWWLAARIESATSETELARVVRALESLGGAAPGPEEVARRGLRPTWQRFLRTLGATWRPAGEGLLP